MKLGPGIGAMGLGGTTPGCATAGTAELAAGPRGPTTVGGASGRTWKRRGGERRMHVATMLPPVRLPHRLDVQVAGDRQR